MSAPHSGAPVSSGTSGTAGRIQPIQYLRALAVLAVVLDHASLQASMDKYWGPDALYGWLLAGFSGVDLFFVISGFIITVVTLDAQWRPRVPLGLFAWNRFVRIVPTMWVAILSLTAMRLLGSGLGDEPPIWSALFLWPWGPVNPAHIWSVRQELAFYAVFALAVFTPVRGVRWLFLAWWLAQVASSFFSPEALGVWADTLLRPVNIHFGWGVVLGALYLKGWFSAHAWGQSRWVAHGQTLWFVGVVALIWACQWEDPTVLAHKLAIGGLFAGLVYASLAVQEAEPGSGATPGWWARTLGFLGEASFSIYLFHVLGQSATLRVLAKLAPGLTPGTAVALTAAGSLAFCCLAYLWIEKPLIARLRPLYRGTH